jgi:hypothetical protein
MIAQESLVQVDTIFNTVDILSEENLKLGHMTMGTTKCILPRRKVIPSYTPIWNRLV